MRSSIHRTAGILLAVLALSGGIVACGGDDEGAAGSDEQAATQGAPVEGKQGGKLTVLWTDDLTFADPGQSYYQMDWMVHNATQRPLYAYKPDNGLDMVPDLAESAPEVSRDGRTVTVKIRDGVRFSAPVDREVTAKDVKYAIERGFFNTVNNGYAGAYFGALRGAEVGAKPGTEIPGIETPDDRTVVFRLTRPQGGVLASGALGDVADGARREGVRAPVRRRRTRRATASTRPRPGRT